MEDTHLHQVHRPKGDLLVHSLGAHTLQGVLHQADSEDHHLRDHNRLMANHTLLLLPENIPLHMALEDTLPLPKAHRHLVNGSLLNHTALLPLENDISPLNQVINHTGRGVMARRNS